MADPSTAGPTMAGSHGVRLDGTQLDVAPLVVDPHTAPSVSDPDLEDHERMAHIVLEGFRPKDGEFVPAGPSVVEGIVNATPVVALCGKQWVPGRDPRRYPLCPTCKEIAEGMGWKVPST